MRSSRAGLRPVNLRTSLPVGSVIRPAVAAYPQNVTSMPSLSSAAGRGFRFRARSRLLLIPASTFSSRSESTCSTQCETSVQPSARRSAIACLTPMKIGEIEVGRTELHVFEISRRRAACCRSLAFRPSMTLRLIGMSYLPSSRGSFAVAPSPSTSSISLERVDTPGPRSICSAEPTADSQPPVYEIDGSFRIPK